MSSRLKKLAGPLLIVLLLLCCALSLPTDQNNFGRPGSTTSSGTDGAQALLMWFDSLGYETRQLQREEFLLDEEDDALFIITPETGINFVERQEMLRWVREDGGTLIIVEQSSNLVLSELGVDIDHDRMVSGDGRLVLPLAYPPVQRIANVSAYPLVVNRENIAPMLEVDEEPVIIAIAEGQGLIIISSYAQPFTNEGLKRDDAALLILNLLNRVPASGRIVFDEIHHGFPAPPVMPQQDWPLDNLPFWGGLVYAVLVTVLYLIWAGKRFGRTIPLREDLARRSSSEYVQSLGSLLERGRQSSYALHHYHDQFKRRLAKPYGLNPRLSDDEFVTALARMQSFDQRRMALLLEQLRGGSVAPERLLALVHEADTLATEIEQGRSVH